MTIWRPYVWTLFLLSAVMLLVPRSVTADAPASFDARGAYIYVPAGAAARDKPLQVVFALHGMGGEGKGFCQSMLAAADRNGWVLVAPTFKYRNWRDPATVAEDDVALVRDLEVMLDTMPERIGHSVRHRAMFYGFSRGAQLAHRFALAYPERTRAVVAMSAGTYTLPRAQTVVDDRPTVLSFPFGIADLGPRLGRRLNLVGLTHVSFLIGVGSDDTRAEDVPRQWDTLLGQTRVQRAEAFAAVLEDAGVPTTVQTFRNVGHAMAPEMVRSAAAFMERAAAETDAEPADHASPWDLVAIFGLPYAF